MQWSHVTKINLFTTLPTNAKVSTSLITLILTSTHVALKRFTPQKVSFDLLSAGTYILHLCLKSFKVKPSGNYGKYMYTARVTFKCFRMTTSTAETEALVGVNRGRGRGRGREETSMLTSISVVLWGTGYG